MTRQFLQSVEHNLGGASTQVNHVNGMDVSDSFEHICSFKRTRKQASKVCALRTQTDLPGNVYLRDIAKKPSVLYTAKSYNPDYSHGIKSVNGNSQIYAYCLRLGGLLPIVHRSPSEGIIVIAKGTARIAGEAGFLFADWITHEHRRLLECFLIGIEHAILGLHRGK